MVVRGTTPAALNGVLTLSTCSNVCLLTDFPFSVTPSVQDPSFAHDYAQAMGQIPLASGLTDALSAGARAGELVVEARRAGAGLRQACTWTPLMMRILVCRKSA